MATKITPILSLEGAITEIKVQQLMAEVCEQGYCLARAVGIKNETHVECLGESCPTSLDRSVEWPWDP